MSAIREDRLNYFVDRLPFYFNMSHILAKTPGDVVELHGDQYGKLVMELNCSYVRVLTVRKQS